MEHNEFNLDNLDSNIFSDIEDKESKNSAKEIDDLQRDQLKTENELLEEKLARTKLENENSRDENWKSHFSKAFTWAFWLLWFCFLAMCITLIFHWLTPNQYHWLKAEELDRIQTFIVAVFASKAVSSKLEKS